MLLLTFLLLPDAAGQDLPLPEQSYVNEFARPGQPTTTLYLWGAVGTTGIWRVERDVDLIQLLSVARVPGIGASQQDVRQNSFFTPTGRSMASGIKFMKKRLKT